MAQWACERCGSNNSQHTATCASCGSLRNAGVAGFSAELATNEPMLQPASGTAVAAPAFEPVLPLGASDLGLGVLAGAIAAAIGTGVWYAVVVLTGWQVGLVAVIFGFLVGRGVVFGAGGRGSIPLVAASAVITFLALGVSEYLIIHHFISEFVGAGVIPVIQPLDLVVEVVVESIQADPVTLLFWGIALFQAVAIPFGAMRSARG